MTPADVAEHLMPKTESMNHEDHLESLIRALEEAREKAKSKEEEEGRRESHSSSKEETKDDEEEQPVQAKEEELSM